MSKSIKKELPDRTIWTNEQGQYHREDGPAVEWTNGEKEWWLNGKVHRINGPATEWKKRYKAWYVNNVYVKIY